MRFPMSSLTLILLLSASWSASAQVSEDDPLSPDSVPQAGVPKGEVLFQSVRTPGALAELSGCSRLNEVHDAEESGRLLRRDG
jgi:hypothetical protein